MESVGWMFLALSVAVGSIGLRLSRELLQPPARSLEQQAAAGLIAALANGGPRNGVSASVTLRVLSSCASTITPGLSKPRDPLSGCGDVGPGRNLPNDRALGAVASVARDGAPVSG